MNELYFTAEKKFVVEEVISEKPDDGLKVVSAKDSQLNRQVILKEISYENKNQKDWILKEITSQVLLEKYTSHTPRIYNAFNNTKEQNIVIEMQKIKGETLREILSANASAPQNKEWYNDRYTFLTETCKSVAEMHKRKDFVHKDLKPENIMINGSANHKEAYIIDFGISGPGMSKGIGTPAYMAPEQHSGVKYHVSQATDVFALGQIGIELFSGAPLIYGEEIIFDPRNTSWMKDIDLSAIGGDAYPALGKVLKKAIAMDPADRYPNAWAMFEDLRVKRGNKKYGR